MRLLNKSQRILLLTTAFLVLCVATQAVAQKPEPQVEDKKSYGKVQKRTYDFKDAGKEMEYGLFVPSKYDKEKKSPLIVALHGMGGTPSQFMRNRTLTDLAEKHGYIVVAPMGYNTKGWYGLPVPGERAGEKDAPKNIQELSEKDVMNVLDIVRKEFTIDDKRIYLMGHSMGGAGTWHLGTKYPEIWAGLAPIAPAAFGRPSKLDKLKDIPVIVVQGEKDTAVKPEGTRRWVDKLKELDITHEYHEFADGDHGNVVSKGMPKIFEFFEKNRKKEENKKGEGAK